MHYPFSLPRYSLLLCLFWSLVLPAQNSLSLAGTWNFALDPQDQGVQQKWFERSSFDETVQLPGSLLENKKGDDIGLHTQWTASIYDSSWFYNPRMAKYRQPKNFKVPFWLSPNKYYVGPAWYQRTVNVPAQWNKQRIMLYLERPHTETQVWVNGELVGMQNSLCVAHEFDLSTFLKTGNNIICIRVDNRLKEPNVGKDSHSITDQTQGNWTGIVGRMELQAGSKVWAEEVQVYPQIQQKSAKVKIYLRNTTGAPSSGKLYLSATAFNTAQAHQVPVLQMPFICRGAFDSLEVELPMGAQVQLWDEFHPTLYRLKVELKAKGQPMDVRSLQFGMREFKIKGTLFTINGRPTFLRGNVENCQFPLTGYAPMDVAAWEWVYRIARSMGINHFRFHSYCPPEAAFIAADLVGMYLQPEGPSWANHGSSLGDGAPIDQYIYEETRRMAKVYGNYASYCMLAYGNEPRGGKQVQYLTQFVHYWKAKDSRRVYTGASVGNSWPLVPANEFMVKAGARGLPWDKLPESVSDYRKTVAQFPVPYVSHELGQWCAFPNFKEISKYTGVYQAKNYELFQEDLQDRGMGEQAEDFLMASGKLQALAYKTEIERALLTPGLAGFQILSLNDYSGQGTALVGVLDAFWDEKGYLRKEEFNRYCHYTVPLARIPRFVYSSVDTFSADLELFHRAEVPMRGVRLNWKISDATGKIWWSGSTATRDVDLDKNAEYGKISAALSRVQSAQKFKLSVDVDNAPFVNDWEFWVYPAQLPAIDTSNILICDTLHAQALARLQAGGKVLLEAAGKIRKGKEIVQYFQPAFWNTSWFKMRPPHTTGILCKPEHPAFAYFPTEMHSNLQWWEIVHKSQVMNLEDFPTQLRPLVQPIDTWFMHRRLGLIVEVKVGEGKLLISSTDLRSNPPQRPVARQLRYSILQYMNSTAFDPKINVEAKVVQRLFTTDSSEKFESYAKQMPDELRKQNP